MAAETGALSFAFPADPAAPFEIIVLVRSPANRFPICTIDTASLDGTLDLSGMNFPTLEVVVSAAKVDVVDVSGAHFRSVRIERLRPDMLPGVILLAQDTKVETDFVVSGRAPAGENPESRQDPLQDVYLHINASGLTAGRVTIEQTYVFGAVFLSVVSKELFPDYAFCSTALTLANVDLGEFEAIKTEFHGSVSLRDATVSRRTAFVNCCLLGYEFKKEIQQHSKDKEERITVYDGDGYEAFAGLALDISSAELGRELTLRNLDESAGWMNWSHARTGVVGDDGTLWKRKRRKFWGWFKRPVRFRLNGFEYDAVRELSLDTFDRLTETVGSNGREISTSGLRKEQRLPRSPLISKTQSAARERIEWLQCQLQVDLGKEFQAQPWTQSAKVFRTQGNRFHAEQILFARERLWHSSLLWNGHLLVWLFYTIFMMPVGYGYRKINLLVIAASFWVLGALAFDDAHSKGFLIEDPKHAHVKETGRYEMRYAQFNPWAYSADVLLPVMDFSQNPYWIPGIDRSKEFVIKCKDEKKLAELRDFYWGLYWIMVVFGWYLSAIFAAAFAGLLERRE